MQFCDQLDNNKIEEAFLIAKEFNLDDEFIRKKSEEVFLLFLSRGYYITFLIKLVKVFNLSTDFIESEEVQEKIKKYFLEKLNNGDVFCVLTLAEEFNLAQEFLSSHKVQRSFVHILSKGHVDSVIKIANTLNLDEKILKQIAEEVLDLYLKQFNPSMANKIAKDFNLNTEMVQLKVNKEFIFRISNKHYRAALEISEIFFINQEFVKQEKEKVFLSMLSVDDVQGTLEIAEYFTFNKDFLESEEVKQAMQKVFVSSLSQGDTKNALKIAKVFFLSQEFLNSQEVTLVAQKAFLLKSSNLERSAAINIAKSFSLSQEFLASQEFITVVQKEFAGELSDGMLGEAVILANTFSISQEFIQKQAQKEFLSDLSTGNIDGAFKIADTFLLSQEFISENIEDFIKKVGLQYSYERLREIYYQDRFGNNLFSYFQNFDINAKQAVMEVLRIDEDINKSVDRRSLEYRKKAQDSLINFGKNKEILETIEKEGVGVEALLNYDVVDYFELGEADKLSFGEKIQQPVDRLPESIASFVKSIISAIEEYKSELVNKTIHEDLSLIEKEISKLETLRDNEQDEKKKQGMTKGVVQLRLRLAMPKEIRVWDKLHAEISKLNKLAQEVSSVNESLITGEKKVVVVTDETTLKESLEHKSSVWGIRKKLTSHLTALKLRTDEVFSVYRETLTLAIGKERADGVMQQIESEIQEHRDHLHTDFETIFSFMNEEKNEEGEIMLDQEVVDDDEYKPSVKAVSELEGRPMSIRVGGRSRQDLYLGNYTTCCIRIDSEYHGSESPIADYVTDLGMQNVIIYDEVTKTPVACAWCWLGKDEETRETALVIDNVEGWQKYTVNFRSQLEKRMKEYLESYAERIQANNLSQGPDYNDLDVIKDGDQCKKYKKIGGYNRATGYYLEAESGENDNDEDLEGFEDD